MEEDSHVPLDETSLEEDRNRNVRFSRLTPKSQYSKEALAQFRRLNVSSPARLTCARSTTKLSRATTT